MKRYSLENQVRIAEHWDLERPEKSMVKAPLTLQPRESPTCSICFFSPQAVSLPFLLERAEQPGWSRSLFPLLIHLPPQQILVSYYAPGTVLGVEDSALTKYTKLHRTLCSLLNPQHLEECQAHTNMGETDLNRNGQSADSHHGLCTTLTKY